MAVIISGQGKTHENDFFDKFAECLSEKYYEDEILIVSNFNAGHKPLDAIVFKKNGVAIIEFKNYGGEIKFDYNGDWKLKDGTIIKGGSAGKSPFEQARENQQKLIEYLRLRLKKEQKIPWIRVIIIFHKDVVIDNSYLQKNEKDWLFVGNLEQGINKIMNINDGEYFSDINFKELPEILNIHKKQKKFFESKKNESIVFEEKANYYKKILLTLQNEIEKSMIENQCSTIKYPLVDGKDINLINIEISKFVENLKMNKISIESSQLEKLYLNFSKLINSFKKSDTNKIYKDESFGYIQASPNSLFEANIHLHIFCETVITIIINEYNVICKKSDESSCLHFIKFKQFFNHTISQINDVIISNFENYNIYEFYCSKFKFKACLEEYKRFESYIIEWKSFIDETEKRRKEIEQKGILAISYTNSISNHSHNYHDLIIAKLSLMSLIDENKYFKIFDKIYKIYFESNDNANAKLIKLDDFELIDYHFNRLYFYGQTIIPNISINEILTLSEKLKIEKEEKKRIELAEKIQKNRIELAEKEEKKRIELAEKEMKDVFEKEMSNRKTYFLLKTLPSLYIITIIAYRILFGPIKVYFVPLLFCFFLMLIYLIVKKIK